MESSLYTAPRRESTHAALRRGKAILRSTLRKSDDHLTKRWSEPLDAAEPRAKMLFVYLLIVRTFAPAWIPSKSPAALMHSRTPDVLFATVAVAQLVLVRRLGCMHSESAISNNKQKGQ